jgi:bifunctional ADP-heptose synthase (sugar kinase/adenylyltransferase)
MAKNVQRNIQTKIFCDILTNTNWYNITKTRYVHEKTNHLFFRVDSKNLFNRINLSDIKFNYKLIVISDYNKGFLSESDIEYICTNHDNVFLDTKKTLSVWAENAKYIKINDFEYEKSKAYLNNTLKSKIIHTMGGNGCEFNGKHFPVKNVEVKDTSGAGDAFMAALCVKYLETTNIDNSIIYANDCAAQVVKHRGVTTI